MSTGITALTVESVKDWLGIDYADAQTERNLAALVAAAQSYMTGALGEDYPEDDPRVIAAQKLVVADLYDNRDLPDKSASATRRVLDSMLTQVRMEMRIAAEAGDGE